MEKIIGVLIGLTLSTIGLACEEHAAKGKEEQSVQSELKKLDQKVADLTKSLRERISKESETAGASMNSKFAELVADVNRSLDDIKQKLESEKTSSPTKEAKTEKTSR